MKTTQFLLITMAVMAMKLTACTKSTGQKDATHEKLTECLGINVPFPASATINNCTDMGEIGKNAQFKYAATWKEAIDFFTEKYSSKGWKLTDEYVETREEMDPGDAPSARWTAVKDDVEIRIELHDYRVDETSGAITGMIAYMYN